MLTYDRRAPEGLLNVLRPGGWAASLAEYGRSGQYALDLQLRGYSKKPAGHWATLYAGLTKVLDLHFLPSKGFRLDVHKTYKAKAYGWNPDWEKYRSRGFDHAEWRAVEDYLETVIPKVDERYMVEGSVQSAVSGFQSRNLTVIDREVAVSFGSQREKERVTRELAGPLLAALDTAGPAWWNGRPAHLGGECDALAVDADGSLLAIEIKPAKASATIPWAPVQVRHYTNLLREWARSAPDAAEVINGMVEQRHELGLVQGRRPHCTAPALVRPVLAIQRGASATVMDRLRKVHRLLTDAGLDDPPLETYEVNLVGRLDPVTL